VIGNEELLLRETGSSSLTGGQLVTGMDKSVTNLRKRVEERLREMRGFSVIISR
jgi:hypothetical protein